MSDDENIDDFGSFSSSSSKAIAPSKDESWDGGEWQSGDETSDSEREGERDKGEAGGEREGEPGGWKDGRRKGRGEMIEGRGLLASEESGDEWVDGEEGGGDKDWCKWD